MGICKGCLLTFPDHAIVDKYCPKCSGRTISLEEQEEKRLKKLSEIRYNKSLLNSIFLTTETSMDLPIEKRIDIVSSQCIYGINMIKDLFNFVRDIVGGRIESVENALENANKQVLEDLKVKAYLEDANAIIGVKIEHTYNNANGGSILSVMATGTLVRLKDKTL